MVPFLNKWLRCIHRWLAVPLVLAIVLTLGYILRSSPEAIPEWTAGLGAVSLLAMLVTGLYMFVQYYWAKWNSPTKVSSPLSHSIHRWFVVPLVASVVLTLGHILVNGPQAAVPEWIAGLGIVSLLSLLVTGLYMFVQYYWAKWKRPTRASSPLSLKGESSSNHI